MCLEKSITIPGCHKKVERCPTIHMKDKLIKVCGQRGDSHAEEVSPRITDAITDLYAADARFHRTCLQLLFHHEIFQLLSNLQQSSRNLILLTSVALLVY